MTCKNCKAKLEVGMFPFCKGNPADHGQPARRAGFRPVVVFRDSAGNVSFPGRSDAKPPKGFERVELTTIRQMEQFERTFNASERSRNQRYVEREQQMSEEARSKLRSDLRNGFSQRMPDGTLKTLPGIKHMSSFGRAMAEAAMRRTDEMPRKNGNGSDFFLEVLHKDQSNRAIYRDRDTDWKGQRW